MPPRRSSSASAARRPRRPPSCALGCCRRLAGGRGQGHLRLVDAGRAARRMARAGLRIGFTNGCFDLLHPGHVRLMTEARAACDRLVVGLNSDASVQAAQGQGAAGAGSAGARRGAGRARSGRSRGDLRAGHAGRSDPPREADGAGEGRRLPDRRGGRPRIVEALGGKVVLVDLVPGYSTTAIVQRSAANSVREPAVTGAKSKR